MKPLDTPECKTPETFPTAISNRPGLDRIRYRAGEYTNARAWILERIDQDPKLAAWTYRGADDPGIALLEGAALLIDSLTFYQEAYANEAFLRTATWRDSVAELVRLLGYRLKPGLGGFGTVALVVTGTKPVTIPEGLAIHATLAPSSQSVTFQTESETVALPWLSKLTLVQPQLPLGIPVGTTKLVVEAGTPLTFARNDRIALGVLVATNTLFPFEVAIVDKVETWHGRSTITLKGPITKIESNPTTLTAIKLDRTFHIAGHTAPNSYVAVDPDGVTRGHIYDPHLSFPRSVLDLEPQVQDLPLGTRLAIQLPQGSAGSFLSIATVIDATPQTVIEGPMTIPSTVVRLSTTIGSNEARDRRTLIIDSATGEPFKVGATWTAIDTLPTYLFWWGDTTHAKDLKGRRIAIAPVEGPSYELNVVDVIPLPAIGLSFVVVDRAVDYADFRDGNTTVVCGNVVDVTEGKPEDDAVLGNGDDRATFQSFQLPKGPLTYLERAALTPPERPEITVVVGKRVWTYVPVLFGQAPDAEVYIIRQDDDGNSWVQFGDGKTGARLPSGIDNVSVRWRTGAGAYGAIADGTTASADRSAQLGSVSLVGVVSGGTDPEGLSTARAVAPARVQSLERMVSITDVHAEALAIGGVSHASAIWTVANGLPVIRVTLLMQPGRSAELESARQVLASANRLRGPQRLPIVVTAGAFEYVYLDLSIAIDPTFDPQPVRDAVAVALAARFAAHTFGEAEYATRIEGVAQNVDGVQWALVNALGSLGAADDPATLAYPTTPIRAATVPCAATHVLQLSPAMLHLHTVQGVA